MKVLERLSCTAIAFAACATASGCSPDAILSVGGSPSLSPLGPSQSQGLLYISNVHTVTVYSYPAGKPRETLKGFYAAGGECVDQNGDVFITNLGTNQIFAYAYGSEKRLRVLTGYGGPVGCSIDPTTGDLAASSLGSGNGAVAVYKQARGKPKIYKSSAFKAYFWCGYDDKGNLFVDGQSASYAFVFAELPKGGSALTTINLNQHIGFPGGVQWDGKHVAIGDQDTSVIYQFDIKGAKGIEAGATTLDSGANDVRQFWIQGQTLIAPNEYFLKGKSVSDVLFFNYPVGGEATQKVTAGVHGAAGAVVSYGRQSEAR